MRPSLSWVLAAAGIAALAGCAAQATTAEAPAPAAPGAPVSVYTGVYSEDQARRGATIQSRACASCHSPNDWSAGQILGAWSGQTAFDLVSDIRNKMPLTAPGSLSLQEYTDIVAYMFELNDIPAGEQEMRAEEAALRNVRLEYRR